MNEHQIEILKHVRCIQLLAMLDGSGWTDAEIKTYFTFLGVMQNQRKRKFIFDLDCIQLPGRTKRIGDSIFAKRKVAHNSLKLYEFTEVFVEAGWTEAEINIAHAFFLHIHLMENDLIDALIVETEDDPVLQERKRKAVLKWRDEAEKRIRQKQEQFESIRVEVFAELERQEAELPAKRERERKERMAIWHTTTPN